jgi:hypothetical protein
MITNKVTLDPKMQKLIKQLGEIDGGVRDATWDKTLEVAETMVTDIKDGIPVDTGRARAGWGHYTPKDLRGTSRKPTARTKKARARGASGHTQLSTSGDAIWIEDESRLQVEQGTNVPYTRWLNEGTSRGTVALGFIDDANEKAEIEMEKFGNELGDLVQGVLDGRRPQKGKKSSETWQPGGGHYEGNTWVPGGGSWV